VVEVRSRRPEEESWETRGAPHGGGGGGAEEEVEESRLTPLAGSLRPTDSYSS